MLFSFIKYRPTGFQRVGMNLHSVIRSPTPFLMFADSLKASGFPLPSCVPHLGKLIRRPWCSLPCTGGKLNSGKPWPVWRGPQPSLTLWPQWKLFLTLWSHFWPAWEPALLLPGSLIMWVINLVLLSCYVWPHQSSPLNQILCEGFDPITEQPGNTLLSAECEFHLARIPG